MKYFRWIFLPMFFSLLGCFGINENKIEDHPMGEEISMPFVEATIQFLGPSEKWMGPENFSIKISTQKSGSTWVTIRPSLGPANHAGPEGQILVGLSEEAAREELMRLNVALHVKEEPFHGCLLPIRVKMIRADGALMERQSCQGQPGWPRLASSLASHFIELAMASSKKK